MKKLKINANIQSEIVIYIDVYFYTQELEVAANLRSKLTSGQRNNYNNFIHRLLLELRISDILYEPPLIDEDEPKKSVESVSTYFTFFLVGPNGGRISRPVIRLCVSDHVDISTPAKRAKDTNDRAKRYAKKAKKEGHVQYIPKNIDGFFQTILVRVEGANYVDDAQFEFNDYKEAIPGILDRLSELSTELEKYEVFED